jgi:hypothetical protein
MVSALRHSSEMEKPVRITRPGEIDEVLDELMSLDWVVYTKHCLNYTASVIDYLARYTHRVAAHSVLHRSKMHRRKPVRTEQAASKNSETPDTPVRSAGSESCS